MICDVCKKNEAAGVVSSLFVAASFAYCQECLDSNREIYGVLVAALMGAESEDDIAEWALPYVYATVKAEGKTMKEFYQDTHQAQKEWDKHWNAC